MTVRRARGSRRRIPLITARKRESPCVGALARGILLGFGLLWLWTVPAPGAPRDGPSEPPAIEWRAGLIDTTWAVRSDSLRLRLPAGWIAPATFRLSRGDTLLIRGVDFLLDPRRGTVRLVRSLPAGTRLRAVFRCFPIPVRGEYRRHWPQTQSASAGGETTEEEGEGSPEGSRSRRPEDSGHLDISGSKTFAVEAGSQQDVSLKQSLDLSVHGRLSRDVNVQAILSDRNTPLQPEGTSTQLEDLDRILVEVEGPAARMTLGDYQLTLPPSEFAHLTRQLQGVRGELTPGRFDLFAAGATSPGNFASLEFLGQEGKQGPYRLRGGQDTEVLLVAGSESVWLDGRRLVRGEQEDYIVDYADGTLTFTGRHVITADSRIAADFQYATEGYRRSVYGTGGGWGDPSSKIDGPRLRTLWVAERDDSHRPVVALSEAQKLALAAAGDSLTEGLRSGIVFLGQGQGDYERVEVDTLATSFFRYAGTGRGSYRIRFEEVGDGQGDYNQVSQDPDPPYYAYVGRKKGRYLPGRAVPRPQAVSLFELSAESPVVSSLRLGGELAVSQYDANTLSPLDDQDNRDLAWMLESRTEPRRVGPATVRLGGRMRQVGTRFHPLDRLDPSFYSVDWNVEPLRLSRGDRRRSVDGEAELKSLHVNARLEDLDNWTDFRGVRTVLGGELRAGPVRLLGRSLRARTRDTAKAEEIRGLRATESAAAEWPGSVAALRAGYSRESSRQGTGGAASGQVFRQGSLRVGTGSRFENLTAAVQWARRWDWILQGSREVPKSTGNTGQADLEWQRSRGRVLSALYSLRTLRPTGGVGRQESMLGSLRWVERLLGSALLQEGRWELSTSELTTRIQDLQRVGAGAGHYDSLGGYTGIGDWEVYYRDLPGSRILNRIDFSLRNELDFSQREGLEAGRTVRFVEGGSSSGAAPGLASRLWNSSHLVHYWTARLETGGPVRRVWGILLPALLGSRDLDLAEVQMRFDWSALPSARWLSPRLRWELSRGRRGVLENLREFSRRDLYGARFRSRPTQRWSVEQEAEWEVDETSRRWTDRAAEGRDGWRSFRLRLDPQVTLREGLTGGVEGSARVRRRIGSEERAQVYEATPLLVWNPRPRSRVEARTTRTSVSRRNPAGSYSRELEAAGWLTRLVATVHLKESLDLSLWARERRPDRGRAVRDGRMELRATF